MKITDRSKKRPRIWIDKKDIDLLAEHYPDSTPEEMIKLFNGRFTSVQITHKAIKLLIRKSEDYMKRFGRDESGKITGERSSWNKGIKYNAGGRSVLTRFKPGSKPKNHRPVGSTRVCSKDGYILVKIEEGIYKYRLLHREVWKKTHGKYPPPGSVVIFKDGNRKNCDPNNLSLITRKELMQLNTVQNMPDDLRKVIALKASLTRRINGNYGTKK